MHCNYVSIYIFIHNTFFLLCIPSLCQLIVTTSVGEKLFLVRSKIKTASNIVKPANLQ